MLARRAGWAILTAWLACCHGDGKTFAFAGIEEKAAALPGRRFCVNANASTAWSSMHSVLRDLEIPITLQDKKEWLLTTAFIQADKSRLRTIARNALPFSNGRFTLKMWLDPQTRAFTKLHIVLQIRQKKTVGDNERLVKTSGNFEKFIADRINQLAVTKQFPGLSEIRLGMNLTPNLENEKYKISDVEPNSPAGEAGFKNGDWLLAIDGREVSIRGELFEALLGQRSIQDGLLSALDLRGSEKKLHFRVKRKDATLVIPGWVVRVKENQRELGISVGFEAGERAFVVQEVKPASPAEKAGLKPGDYLLAEDGIELSSWTNYYRAMARSSAGRHATFTVLRSNQELVLKV